MAKTQRPATAPNGLSERRGGLNDQNVTIISPAHGEAFKTSAEESMNQNVGEEGPSTGQVIVGQGKMRFDRCSR